MLALRDTVSGGIGCDPGIIGYGTKWRGWGPLIEPGGPMGAYHTGGGPKQKNDHWDTEPTNGEI